MGSFDTATYLRAFDELTDAVVILDDSGTIVYSNPYIVRTLGWELEDVIGKNIADYLHPEDLVRAAEILSRMADGNLGVPLTPAEYRFRRTDGTWIPIEVNGSMFDPEQPGLTLAIGRYSGDHDIQNRILQLLTAGRPLEAAIDIVPEFGSWRHPDDHYVVMTRDATPGWRAAGSALAIELIGLDVGASPWDLAASTGHEQRLTVDELPPALATAAESRGFSACWAVPVPDPRHLEPAVLLAWTRVDGPATEVHVYCLEMMERALRLILLWGQQVAGLEWAARHDALTGAINRSRFFRLLEELTGGTDTTIGVLYADLDGFKAINDAHGHAVGDAVLREVAARFTHAIAAGHVLARLGGDEFAVLCPALAGPWEATDTAAAIVESMQDPIAVGDLVLAVGVSVGVATAAAETMRPDPLVEQADRGLYAAKASGRGRWVVG